jgi:limonene 1,2-monooxygenase
MTIKLRNGIFRAPFHPVDEDPTLCIQRDLELIDHLDRLGYDEAWIGEHHSAGFEIIASPELFIAAAAERTKRIKLGSGVISLPYHNPLMAANRVIQLDHQTKGRFMFGVGPGLLPSDAFSMGIDPSTQRDRMVESIEIILRLFAGERVTHKSEWFTLADATCQLRPFTWPHPEIAVASSVTPSAASSPQASGFACCVAATQEGGQTRSASTGKSPTTSRGERPQDDAESCAWSVRHIAETRAEAFENVKFGIAKWQNYFGNTPRRRASGTETQTIEQPADSGQIVVGTPDDAIAQIRRLQAKQGEFGVFLQLAHNWANFENTKKSYELWQRHVTPVINGANVARQEAYDWATDPDRAGKFIGAAMTAAMNTIQTQ